MQQAVCCTQGIRAGMQSVKAAHLFFILLFIVVHVCYIVYIGAATAALALGSGFLLLVEPEKASRSGKNIPTPIIEAIEIPVASFQADRARLAELGCEALFYTRLCVRRVANAAPRHLPRPLPPRRR